MTAAAGDLLMNADSADMKQKAPKIIPREVRDVRRATS